MYKFIYTIEKETKIKMDVFNIYLIDFKSHLSFRSICFEKFNKYI